MPMLTTSVIFERAHLALAKARHGGEHGVDVRHHVAARHHHRRVGAVAQRRVQHGAALGGVDDVAREHRVALALDVRRLGELREQLHGARVDGAFRIVEQQVVDLAENSRSASDRARRRAACRSGAPFLRWAFRSASTLRLSAFAILSSSSVCRPLPCSPPARSSPTRPRSRLRSASCPSAAGVTSMASEVLPPSSL